jgi:hypothetical protein
VCCHAGRHANVAAAKPYHAASQILNDWRAGLPGPSSSIYEEPWQALVVKSRF